MEILSNGQRNGKGELTAPPKPVSPFADPDAPPRRKFSDMSTEQLAHWLYHWGHTWPEAFIRTFGKDLVAGVLDIKLKSPDVVPDYEFSPRLLVFTVRSRAAVAQEADGIVTLPRAHARGRGGGGVSA